MAGPRARLSYLPYPVGYEKTGGIVYDSNYGALLATESHFKLRNGSWSGGGPFFCYQRRISHGRPLVVHLEIGSPPFIQGNWYCKGAAGIEAGVPASLGADAGNAWFNDKLTLRSYYATGRARTRPGNPVASLGQFIGELRDLPKTPLKSYLRGSFKNVGFKNIPKFMLATLLNFRAHGSEYLNVQFGWKPFVRDLRQMYQLWWDIDRRMAQLVRENGRNIRRKATLVNDRSVTTTSTTYSYPYANVYGGPPTFMSGQTVYTVRVAESLRIWFVGGYRYYIPDVGSSQWNRRARVALFGGLPTPDVLYQLMPWSWLLDWFTNVGDVVSNLSVNAVDNLVSNYSFTMREYSKVTEHTAYVTHDRSDGYYSWPYVSHAFRSTDTVVTKARLGGGNPYGLDVPLASLSPYQLSILAALGISRAKVS